MMINYINKPTSLQIQDKFQCHLKRKKHEFIIQNIYLFSKESDILSVKNGILYEFEVKTNSSDFEKDIRKKRHQGGMPNYFYYIVDSLLTIKGNYLEYAGFILCKRSKDGFFLFDYIKPADLIRTEKVTYNELYQLLIKNFNKTNG